MPPRSFRRALSTGLGDSSGGGFFLVDGQQRGAGVLGLWLWLVMVEVLGGPRNVPDFLPSSWLIMVSPTRSTPPAASRRGGYGRGGWCGAAWFVRGGGRWYRPVRCQPMPDLVSTRMVPDAVVSHLGALVSLGVSYSLWFDVRRVPLTSGMTYPRWRREQSLEIRQLCIRASSGDREAVS